MDKRPLWIQRGYTLIAEKGIKDVNVELLASSLSGSKSSFYHYFGNFDQFKIELLKHHILKSEQLSHAITVCNNLMPDMLQVFVDNKEDILFHKQIRIYRNETLYKECFEKAYRIVESAILEKWVAFLGFENQPILAKSILNLTSDNFLLRVTFEDFTFSWLENYAKEMSYLVQQIKVSQNL